MEGQRVRAIKEFDRAAPTIQKLYDLQTKYRGQVWTDFTTLVHDETMAGVYADRPLSDQKHISKEGSKDSWQRKQYPDLAARYAALPDDLKQARAEAMDYFQKKQNEIALKLIRNRIVTLFDTTDPDGLAQRIHDGSVTDADKELMGEAYDAIAAAGVLSKINGPYFPLMRRGNFVVKGRYKVPEP
jgi:thioredoxin-like negative regulator of GroEL